MPQVGRQSRFSRTISGSQRLQPFPSQDAGFDGLALSFVNYGDELGYFAQKVLPRLEKLGIR